MSPGRPAGTAPAPIDAILPDVLDALRSARTVVVHAPTGAGKTTRLPAALLDAWPEQGAVWTLEPRRIAARAAARFVGRQRGSAPGDEVGWHVRFEPRFSRTTRLLYLTDGVAVRRLADDPFLEGVQAVVVDELHERSLNTDLALAMLRRIQDEVRPDLRLVLMSATLDTARLASTLGAPVVASEGRAYPVKVHWSSRPDDRHASVRCVEGVRRALREQPGDVLAFLPGVGEIHRTQRDLGAVPDVDILPLYGALPAAEQDRALVPGPRRRVVLATNVAETSLTLEGIHAVVDTGLARFARHDPASGLDRLVLEPISQASSDQRAGRAGRTAPGVVYRLWTERDHRGRPAFDEPEILRADLAGTVLQLRAWGEAHPVDLPWLQPPTAHALDAADTQLRSLGLLDRHGLTPLGLRAVRLPLHPRLGVLVLSAHRQGHPHTGALAAACLAGRDPFRRQVPGRDAPVPSTPCDVYDRVLAVRARGGPRLRTRAIEDLDRIAQQILRHLEPAPTPTEPEGRALQRALSEAWPDRIALRRAPDSERALLRGGRGVRLTEASGVRDAELFVAVQVDDGPQREGLVRIASAVDRAWIVPTQHTVLQFDPERRQVTAREQTRLDALILHEHAVALRDDDAVHACLLDAVRADPALLPIDDPAVDALLARLELLCARCPELGMPEPDADWIDASLPTLLIGRRGIDDLTGAALASHLHRSLSWPHREHLDAHAPERLRVPSGRALRIAYARGHRPVLAVRMQELFGLEQTPRVARGREPLVLHLLAPNGRPAQITDDLPSFWSTTWTEVRKDLRARYPKHDWPVDPRTATPSRGVRRR